MCSKCLIPPHLSSTTAAAFSVRQRRIIDRMPPETRSLSIFPLTDFWASRTVCSTESPDPSDAFSTLASIGNFHEGLGAWLGLPPMLSKLIGWSLVLAPFLIWLLPAGLAARSGLVPLMRVLARLGTWLRGRGVPQ